MLQRGGRDLNCLRRVRTARERFATGIVTAPDPVARRNDLVGVDGFQIAFIIGGAEAVVFIEDTGTFPKLDAGNGAVAEDARHVNAIERFIGQKIPRTKLEDFEYRYTALFEEQKPGRQAGIPRITGARIRGGYYFGPARRRR